MEERKRRYAGIDLGKREYTMAIIGTNGKMTIHKGKTSTQGRQKLYALLGKTDKVALEAGNLAFRMALEIQSQTGSEVRVLNSAKLPLIWNAPTKTDKEDAMKLAHLMEERRDDQLPLVAIPDKRELERRTVLANYRREQRDRTRNINTLHALFLHQGLTTIVKKDLATDERRLKAVELLTGRERESAEWLLKHLALHEARIAELKSNMRKEAEVDENIKLLKTVCGVGEVIAYSFVAYVGDGSRFGRGSQVSNYLGLVPRLDYSGTIKRQGHISKRGNGYVRSMVVQAAWAAVRSKRGGALRERYLFKTKGTGTSKKKTIIGIARRLTEMMYAVLRNGTPYESRPWIKGKSLSEQLADKALSA